MQQGLDRFPQVFDEMKPIDHLHGVWSATANAVCIEGTPIATDHRHGRMLGEPVGDKVRRALGQEVKHLVILQVDQDGAIALPASPGPLIDPQHLGTTAPGAGAPCTSRNRVSGLVRQPQSAPEPCAHLPAEGHAAGAQALGEPQGPAGPGGRHRRETFRENLAGARGLVTKKLAHTEVQAHRIRSPWQIGQGAAHTNCGPVGSAHGRAGSGHGHGSQSPGA